jgi:hypothetical protein
MAELIVRGSEYQSFLNCRKQWFYQWYEGIEAKSLMLNCSSAQLFINGWRITTTVAAINYRLT